MDAQDFAEARERLAPLLSDPTQRVCLLMAELEATESGDHGKAREWTARAVRARRDPAWVADGYVSERWLPISPVSGKLDAFVWTMPPDALTGPVLEQVAQQALAEAAAKQQAHTVRSIPAPVTVEPARSRARRKAAAEPVVAEPPLPDDPGPEVDGDKETSRRRFRLFDWLAGPTP
jgi:HemY protein